MLISVIIRTRNEEFWLPRVFHALSYQKSVDFEVIIVDNQSTDRSVEIAKQHGAKICEISRDEFTYGLSINRGIEASRGDLIALLSGHCIPVDEFWLYNLQRNFCERTVAGCYGRQLPLPDSSDFDKRDLWTTFGVEKKVQTKDFFFHNANSMISKRVWQEIPFDNFTKGVEDRVWAKEVIRQGYELIYDPAAAVFHQHGIHQGRDEARAARVVSVIKDMYEI